MTNTPASLAGTGFARRRITLGLRPACCADLGIHFCRSVNPQLRLHLQQAGAFICFLFLMGGVSRLARIHISHDAQPRNPGRPDRKYVCGDADSGSRGLLAATIHLCYGIPVQAW